MDIYGAQKCMEKLKGYVQDVYECRPGMYKKSKDRFRDIASTCIEVVDLISVIIEDASLSQDAHEFCEEPTNDDPDMHEMLMDIGHKLDTLQKFINEGKINSENNDSMDEEDIEDTSITEDIDDNVNTVITNNRDAEFINDLNQIENNIVEGIGLSPQPTLSNFTSNRQSHPIYKKRVSESKQLIHEYANVLSRAPNNCINTYAKECSQIINKWFETRFLKCTKTFKYNVKYIGKWIQAIVFGYGKALNDGKFAVERYINDMYTWINKLHHTNNKYPLPYHVYQLVKEVPEDYAVRDTLILWDMLLNSGYHKICKADKKEIYMRDYTIPETIFNLDHYIDEQLFSYIDEPEKLKSLWWGDCMEVEYV